MPGKKRMRNTQSSPTRSFPSLNVTDLLAAWRQDIAADHAPSTIYRYTGAVARFLTWYESQEYRPLDLAALTPIALVGYRNMLQQTATTSTVNTHVCALRAFGQWLQTNGHLDTNPAARLKLVGRQPIPAPQALTDSQVNALLRAAARTRHSARDTAIIQVLLQTGIRIGECAMLRMDDVTFGEKRGWLHIRAGKGNKARSIPLNSSVHQALADYVAARLGVPARLKAVADAWPQPQPSVRGASLWHSQKDAHLSSSAIGRLIDSLVQGCAVRGLVPADTSAHTLRHTFASRYLNTHAGDLVGLAALLGHSSLDSTRIYTQPTADQLAARLEQLDLNAFGR
jgi:site-specific recombinase XerD